jgi:hypothetical protein
MGLLIDFETVKAGVQLVCIATSVFLMCSGM